MPYKVFAENDKFCVYTLDAEGKPKGSPHGCHPTREAAERQKRALYVHASPESEKSLLDRIGLAVKSWFTDVEQDSTAFMVWKEADRFRWLATFSNKYRDRDNPPEILADAAHREFVQAVDNKEWPMPELWHWHIPGSRWGQADMVTYDGAFTLASGWIDAGHEAEAEALAAAEGIKVSHGMPVKEIRRAEDDPTIITRYRSIEISDLPDWAAANPLTGFEVVNGHPERDHEGGKTMISDEKKDYLRSMGLTDDKIAQLEADLEGKAKQADGAGLESKEAEVQPAATTEPLAAESVTPPGVSADEIAQAIAAAVKPILEQLQAMGETIKELKRTDEAKIAEKAAGTPAASLRDLVVRAIGQPETRIDGRSALAKDAPKEAPVETPTITGVPFLDSMLSQSGKPS